MKIARKIKKDYTISSVFYFLIFFPVFCLTGTSKLNDMCIKAISSALSQRVILENQASRIIIAGQNKNNKDLCKPVEIPFVSITKYIKEYAEFANGKKFIPKEAIKINIGNSRLYGIWKNEAGLMLSPDPSTDDPVGPKVLIKNYSQKYAKNKLIQELKDSKINLLLLIDKNGQITVETV